MNDPLVDEVRAIRHKISERYNHDPKRYIEHLMELEQKLRASGRYRFIPSKSSLAITP
jgi:hypothetical protein